MNVLLIGSGGREHALAWALSASPLASKIYCAPGNGGIADVAECVEIAVGDHTSVIRFCKDNRIDLVVVGPEAPLVAGLVDDLTTAGIKCFGPTQAAAQLEASKGFTKDLCAGWDIPTAAYGRFSDAAAAKAFIAEKGAPIVVKADGLAAGKGVIIAMTTGEADTAIDAILGGRFGAAGAEVVVEEFLEGEEASFFALCDGTHVLPLATAQDHKRVFDNDEGPNTGGMGAYSPAPVLSEALQAQVMREIVEPTVRTMAAEGTPYSGVLYAGLMLTKDGPQLIEYNARFGDPECQVLMMRLESDLVELMQACAQGRLGDIAEPVLSSDFALTVVMAADGYPGTPKKGGTIDLGEAEAAGAKVFHAGTALKGETLTSSGGRVLNVTARGASATEAQAKAYEAVDAITFPDGFCRRDIGQREVRRERG